MIEPQSLSCHAALSSICGVVTHAATAAGAGRAGWLWGLARSFGDGASSATDQAFDMSSALGALIDRGV